MNTTTSRYKSATATLIEPCPHCPFHRLEITTPSSQASLAHNKIEVTLSPEPGMRIVELPQGPGAFTTCETSRLADMFFVAARAMGKVEFGFVPTTADRLIQ